MYVPTVRPSNMGVLLFLYRLKTTISLGLEFDVFQFFPWGLRTYKAEVFINPPHTLAGLRNPITAEIKAFYLKVFHCSTYLILSPSFRENLNGTNVMGLNSTENRLCTE